MRKNFGFTLAEVLITLTIIGVVSALAAPILIGSFQKSKVGPSLRKFVSTMENANEHILVDNDSDLLSHIVTSNDSYFERLSKYVKGAAVASEKAKISPDLTAYDGTAATKTIEGNEFASLPQFVMTSGEAFYVDFRSAEQYAESKANAQGGYKGHFATIYYDMNGFGVKPNRYGKDMFIFVLDDNGSVLPNGGAATYSAYGGDTQYIWKDGSSKCNETNVSPAANACSGSIADNGWKVIYKY